MRSSRRLAVLLLLVTLPLGCRTYGGHGTEDATLRQIEAAQAQFARDLVQARNDLRSLTETVGGNAALQPAVEAYQSALQAHEALVHAHEGIVEDARSNPGAYRYLSRTLRGMHSEQEAVYRRYQRIQRTVHESAVALERPGTVIPRYHVVPPYFARIENASHVRSVGGMWRSLPSGAATSVLTDDAGEAGPGPEGQQSAPQTPAPDGVDRDGDGDGDAGTSTPATENAEGDL